MSLWVYRDLIKAFQGTAFFDSLESLFKKVQVTLPPTTLAYLDRIKSTFSVDIKPYKEYGPYREIINQANQAALDCKSIEIAYTPLRTDKETIRKVDPYKIWFHDGSIYLIGHCHLRGEVRMFVVDRMKLVRLTEDHFEIPKNFDFEKYMRHRFKVMQGELYEVKILISPEWSRWVGEKIWHSSQRVKRLKDGSLEVCFDVAGLQEIKMWVLGLGGEAKVIKPDSLRKEILEEARKIAHHYLDDQSKEREVI